MCSQSNASEKRIGTRPKKISDPVAWLILIAAFFGMGHVTGIFRIGTLGHEVVLRDKLSITTGAGAAIAVLAWCSSNRSCFYVICLNFTVLMIVVMVCAMWIAN